MIRISVAVVLVIAGVATAGIFLANMTKDQKEIANTVAVAAGARTKIPWAERGKRGLERYLRGGGANSIGQYVIGTGHPSGSFSSTQYELYAVNEDTVVADFTLAWRGGIRGGSYETDVRWTFGEGRSEGVLIGRDTGPVSISAKNQRKIESYFPANVLPMALQEIRSIPEYR